MFLKIRHDGAAMAESIRTVQLRNLQDRIRAGDRAARDELLRGVCDHVNRLVRQMGRQFPRVMRWVETDDVLQGTLLRLTRALDEVDFQSMRDFFGLASTHIRRELLDLARRYTGPHNDAAHHDSRMAGGIDLPDESADSSSLADWARFHEAVEALPSREREVVGLIHYHEWTQAEVAELFQVDVRTVRRWWQSALIKLSKTVRGNSSSGVALPSSSIGG